MLYFFVNYKKKIVFKSVWLSFTIKSIYFLNRAVERDVSFFLQDENCGW